MTSARRVLAAVFVAPTPGTGSHVAARLASLETL